MTQTTLDTLTRKSGQLLRRAHEAASTEEPGPVDPLLKAWISYLELQLYVAQAYSKILGSSSVEPLLDNIDRI